MKIKRIKQSTPSIFSFLPQEIIDEILKRLPVKSLVRFTCVCKRWRSLIYSDADFNIGLIGHADRPEWNYIETFRQDDHNNHYHTKIFRFIKRSSHKCSLSILQNDCPSEIRNPKILGQCYGLSLIGDLTTPPDSQTLLNKVSKLFLWNPCINSIKRLDTPPSDTLQADGLISGLAYDHTRDDLIAIAFFQPCSICHIHPGFFWPIPGYMISLRRNKWSFLEAQFDDALGHTTWDRFKFKDKIATTIDGIPYWLADYEGIRKLVCFDPVNAKFVQVPLPDFMQHHPQNSMRLRLGALQGLLCAIIDHRSYFEVWTMKKNVEKSCCWTKLYTFNRPNFLAARPLPLGYSNQGKELIFADRDRFWRFDISHGTATSIKPSGFRSLDGSVYAETLFCPWQSTKIVNDG